MKLDLTQRVWVCRIGLVVAWAAAGYCASLADGKWALAFPFIFVGGGICDCYDETIREFERKYGAAED